MTLPADPTGRRFNELDIMNDPAFAPNSGSSSKSAGNEPDTCRICRGEGSKDEPLFHPCKCSGSIKFVHQECLMEWLTHSNKKYCELCKTPFRFTKLYDPQMPRSLPISVFVRQIVAHTAATLLTWLRLLLVGFVWLGWLPWSMRAVWRFLFWLGDAGWARWQRHPSAAEQALAITKKMHAEFLSLTATSPAAQTVPFNTSPSTVPLPSLMAPFSQTLNMSSGEPMALRIFRSIYGAFGLGRLNALVPLHRPSNSSVSHMSVIYPNATSRHPSVLSNVTFLNRLTRSQSFNNVIVDTLEGQMITLLVVVAFILVFLIREWVVQQQPGIALGPGFDNNMAPLPRRAAAIADAGPVDDPRPAADVAHADIGRDVPHDGQAERSSGDDAESGSALGRDGDGTPVEAEQLTATGNSPAGRARPMARARKRVHYSDNEEDSRDDWPSRSLLDAASTSESAVHDAEGEHSFTRDGVFKFQGGANTDELGQSSRPTLPTGRSASKAAEIQRSLEEESRSRGRDWPGLGVFLDLWRRAENNPETVLEIIYRENRQDELRWIVHAMKRLQDEPQSLASQHELGDKLLGRTLLATSSDRDVEGGVALFDKPTGQGEGPDDPLTARKGKQRDSIRYDEDNSNADIGLPQPDERGEWTEDSPSKSSYQEPARNGSIEPAAKPESSSVRTPKRLNTDRVDSTLVQPENSSSEADSSATSSDHDTTNERAVQVVIHAQRRGLLNHAAEWLWGDIAVRDRPIDPIHENDEQLVQDIAAEAPFVPVANIEDHRVWGDDRADAEAVAGLAAELDANEVEMMEDGEDFDGVMELVGMRGPLTGLFQNAMFSAVLISTTLALCVYVPYIWGKLVLLIMGNPVSFFVRSPLRWFSSLTDFVVDFLQFLIGSFVYWTDQLLRLGLTPISASSSKVASYLADERIAQTSRSVADAGMQRLVSMLAGASFGLPDHDFPIFSVLSRETLMSLKQNLSRAFSVAVATAKAIQTGELSLGPLAIFHALSSHVPSIPWRAAYESFASLGSDDEQVHRSILSRLMKPDALRIVLDMPKRTSPVDLSLAEWSSGDRSIAVAIGYAFFSIVGALYVRRGAPFSGKRIEGVVFDVLQQAGGVLKVILIISIEMIVFPLYCGMLLDIALLPLFESATFQSRLMFSMTSPWTSMFVHWFVGTCYMFHFALFVSMCRKIMRSGVLYFIRDPDDPTFHPVRDVLERNVATQLRKITFSALVYGGLVMICLGGVVWGLKWASDDILPIHWSSNEPVLEFPVDLLFYNFLMPLMIRYLNPSDGLHAMYTWWFRKCAGMLRLTWFLFDERVREEEGRHVRRTWWDVISLKRGDINHPIFDKDEVMVGQGPSPDAYFLKDGRYVRTPASDQVRIPKGAKVFIETDEEGDEVASSDTRRDVNEGAPDPYSDLFTKVYIPPLFGLRIALFIFLIWIFTAVTGVALTVLPLLYGRSALERWLPDNMRMNDVYAFSIGIYLSAGTFYAVFRAEQVRAWVWDSIRPRRTSPKQALLTFAAHLGRLGRIVYTYGAFGILLPSLLALVMELYVIIPMHSFLAPKEAHVIHFMQDWTLGVLYVKIVGRLILWHRDSRPAEALRAVVGEGWLNPDVRLATRCFIFPATAVLVTALVAPLSVGWITNVLWFRHADAAVQSATYRYSYPSVLATCISMGLSYLLGLTVDSWKQTVRDDVYLIGERLHNFGESKMASMARSHARSRVTAEGGN
ncbi:MAG: hypothetical protein M1825_004305 [Sarcosagium campestre]|nr:MAG: hypothetical protein M1825_004305 [Sarcosagium campestre]